MREVFRKKANYLNTYQEPGETHMIHRWYNITYCNILDAVYVNNCNAIKTSLEGRSLHPVTVIELSECNQYYLPLVIPPHLLYLGTFYVIDIYY